MKQYFKDHPDHIELGLTYVVDEFCLSTTAAEEWIGGPDTYTGE